MKNKITQLYDKAIVFIKNHRFISSVVIMVVIFSGYYGVSRAFSTTGQTRYVLGNVATSTIISTVSGSGQISASDEVDIKPKVSGEIVWLNVKAGDKVSAGQALMGIDSTDAKQALTSAEQSLITSQLQYQKDSASAPIDYQNALDSLDTAKENLDTTYNDTFNTLSNTYLDLPSVITGAQNNLYGYDLNSTSSQWNVDFIKSMFNDKQSDNLKINSFADIAATDYKKARAEYDADVVTYKQTNRNSSNSDISDLLDQSITLTTDVAQALQIELNLLGLIVDTSQIYDRKVPTAITTMQNSARSYLSTVNNDLSNLLSEKKAITAANQNIKTYQQNITLLQVGNTTGDNPISLQISKNNLISQEENIAQLKSDLQNYTIVAPFDGTVSVVNVKKGDTASGAVATVITNNQIAQLSLNEVDAAKVSVGDKATLTFDAVSDLTMTGVVVEKDTVGTVSSGVVSYTVKISLDTQDSRISPGMTVNASIQTAVKQNVLVVPTGAVKTKNSVSYVQVFSPALDDEGGSQGVVSKIVPTSVMVTTGISDNTNIEITSGLSGGEQIVTKTISGSATTKTTTTSGSSAKRTTTGILSGSAGGPPGGF
jgi:HlyD family secretion protein